MHQRLAVSALLLASTTLAVEAWQSRPTAFDVVSVKRFATEPERGPGGSISILPGGRFSAPAATLRGLIAAAYGLLNIQVVDSARMLGNERFELEGRTSPDVTVAEARAMLRTVLTERFGLVAPTGHAGASRVRDDTRPRGSNARTATAAVGRGMRTTQWTARQDRPLRRRPLDRRRSVARFC